MNPTVATQKARDQMAGRMLAGMLHEGVDCNIWAVGKTLNIYYPAANRATAYQLREQGIEPYHEELVKLGFKSVVLRNAIGYEWSLLK